MILAGSLDLSVAYVISLSILVAAETMAGQDGGILPAVARGARGQRRDRAGQRAARHQAADQRVHRDARRRAADQGYLDHLYDGPAGSVPASFQRLGYHRSGRSRSRRPALVAVAAAAWFLLRRTPLRPPIYAVGGDPEVARLSGVRNDRVLVTAHVLCSLCAGLAGIYLASRLGSGAPTVGTDGLYDLESIAAVVLGGTALAGGRGGVAGTVGGVLLLAVLDSVFNQLEVDAFFKDVVRGVVIVAAVAVYARRSEGGDPGMRRRSGPCGPDLPGGAGRAAGAASPLGQPVLPGARRASCAFVKRAAPLVILAAGQYFVIVSGRVRPVGRVAGHGAGRRRRPADRQRAGARPGRCCCSCSPFGLLVGLVNGLITTAPAGAVVHHHARHVPDPVRRGLPVVRRRAEAAGSPRSSGGSAGGPRRRRRSVGASSLLVLRRPRRSRAAHALRLRPDAVAIGDNARTAELSRCRGSTGPGPSPSSLSGLAAAVAGILLGGYAGVSAQVGQGLEFRAITAVVLGGVAPGRRSRLGSRAPWPGRSPSKRCSPC